MEARIDRKEIIYLMQEQEAERKQTKSNHMFAR